MPIVNCKTGVYKIVNKANGKVYVGGAYKSFTKRFYMHRWALNKGCHFNPHLQRAWNKYGGKQFVFFILERCSPRLVKEREQYWIDTINPHDPSIGYNQSYVVGCGYKGMHTKEGIEKLRNAQLGKKHSQEYCDNIRKRMLGNKNLLGHIPSELTRAKIGKAAKGRPLSELGKKKASERMKERNKLNPPRKGKKCSEEHKRKVSEGRKRFFLQKRMAKELGDAP